MPLAWMHGLLLPYNMLFISENAKLAGFIVIYSSRVGVGFPFIHQIPLSWARWLSKEFTSSIRPCRFLLHNIRRIRPFLTTETAQVFMCFSMIAGLPLYAYLLYIQNTASCLVHNLSKFPHVTTLLRSLHKLPSKFLSLNSRHQKGSTPHYLCTHACQLRSSNSGQLTCPPLRSKHDSNAGSC